uniref:Neuroblast differentiation-associated protein AHNAK-like isoform X4 n=1 Tax=Petromyzon marinus TaxID=7757 RepID=A0AAJ7T705_PETMA|nr:neuroblast differentiation-associated protein AHNAK-like isoform X4 [Petromyzon marinus]
MEEHSVVLDKTQGLTSDDFSIEDRGQEGIFIKDVQKDSLRQNLQVNEGDQIVSATIYFKDMKREDAMRLLQMSDKYKTGLRLRRGSVDGLLADPYDADVYSPTLRSPDYSFQGPNLGMSETTDQCYKRIFNKKIKPRLSASAETLDVTTDSYEMEAPEGNYSTSLYFKGPQAPRKRGEFDATLPSFGSASVSGDATGDFRVKPKATSYTLGPHEITFEGSEGKFRSPNVGISGPNVKGPNIDMNNPRMKNEGTYSTIGLPKMTLPKFGLSGSQKVQMPHIDFKAPMGNVNVPARRIEGPDFDVSAPKIGGNMKMPKADIKGPNVGLDIDAPNIDVNAPEAKLKKPKLTMPKFSLSGSKVHGPDVDVDLKSPKGNVNLSAPKVGGKVSGPDFDLDGPEGSIKGTKLKMPKFSLSGPKVSGPDLDLDLKKPKAKGDINISAPNIEGGIKAPKLNADLEAPDIRVKGPKGKINMPELNKPSFGMSKPKLSGPEGDFDVNLPDANLDISSPNFGGKIKSPKVDLKAPKMGLDVDAPDIDIHSPDAKFKKSKFSMPKFGMSGPKIHGPNVDVDLKAPKGDLDISAPNIGGNFSGPNIDLDGPGGSIKGPHLKMPKFNVAGPKLSGPDVDLKMPKMKGGLDLSAPHIDANLKAPKMNADLEAPDIDVKGPKGKFHMPSFGLSKPKISGPDGDFDVNLPDADLNLSGPKIGGGVKTPKLNLKAPNIGLDVDEPNIDLHGPDVKLKKPTFSMPKMSGPKLHAPDLDVDLKAPKGDFDISAPNIGGNLSGPNIDLDGPGGSIKGPHLKMPKFNLSGPKLSGPDLDANLKMPKMKGGLDISAPHIEGDFKGPKLNADLDAPDIDLKGPKGKFNMPDLKMPSFGMSKPKISGPDSDFDVNLPDADFNLSGPKLGGGIKKPKVDLKAPNIGFDVNAPDIDLHGPDLKLKKPTFSMPKMSGPKLNAPDLDVDLKAPKGDFDISAPNIGGNVSGPNIDLDGPGGSIKGPHLKMPKFNLSGPKLSGPDLDANLKMPKMKGGLDISAPHFEGDLKAPKLNADLDAPDIDLKGPKGKFNMPDLKMPSFGMSKPKISGPDGDFDVNLPDADLNISGPKLGGGIKAPKLNADLDAPDIDLKGPKGKFNMPDLKMPSFGMSKPKISGPDGDFDVNLPDADLNISGPKLGGGIKAPKFNADLDAPDIDLKGPKGKFNMPDLKMPSFGMSKPKISGPDGDFDVNLPDADLNISGPKLGGGIKTPKVDLKAPNIDLEGPDINLNKPKFSMPKISGPKLHAPNLDVDLKAPKGDIDISAPNIGGKISGPNIDLDAPGGNIKGPHLKMPKFNMSGPKLSGPNLDVDLKMPKMKGGLDISAPRIEGDLKAPKLNADLEAPDIDVKGPKGKFHMPSFGISKPKLSGPDGDFDVNLPDADLNISGPKLGGGIKAPKFNANLDAPDIDLKGPKGKFNMPDLKMPSFGMSKPNISGPDGDFDVNLPDADLNISGPKLGGGIKTPKVDLKAPNIDLDGPDINLKKPKFSMPKISGPKLHAPNLDVDLKAPKGDISAPNIGGKISGPNIDLDAPGGNIKGPHLKMPKFNMSGPKLSGPDVDLKMPKIKGGLDLSAPHIDANLKAPKLNADLEAPDIDVKGPKGKFHMPSFGISKPKISGPDGDFDVNLPDADLNLSGPKIGGRVDMPKVDLKGPNIGIKQPKVNIDSPNLSLEGPDIKTKSPKFKLPKFGTAGKKISVPDLNVDLNTPNIKGAASIPDVNIEGGLKTPKTPALDINMESPNIDITGPHGTLKKSKFKFPKVGFSGSKAKAPTADLDMPNPNLDMKMPNMKGNIDLKSPNVDFKAPDIGLDANAPDFDIQGPDLKLKKPKISMPKFGISGPKLHGPDFDVDLKAPKGNFDVSTPKIGGKLSGPNLDLDGPEAGIKGPNLKMPTFNMSGPKLSGPDLDANLKMPKVKGGLDISGPHFEGDLKAPKVNANFDAPDVDLKGPKGKFHMPSFGMSKPKISGPDGDFDVGLPDADLNISGPKLGGGMKAPKVNANFDAPDVDLKGPKGKFHMPSFGMSKPKISGPDGDFDADLPDADLNISGPKLGGDLKAPKVNANFDAPDVDLKGPKGKFHMPSFGMSKPKISGPDGDFDADLPDADLNISGPKLGGDLKAPKVNANFDAPDVDLKGPKGKFHMPSFGISKPKISGPDGDFDVGLPDADLNISGPKLGGGMKAPKVNANFDAPDVDLKGPKGKFHMPSFGMSKPKISGPDGDFDADLPDADLNISGPKLGGGMKAPKVNANFDAPDVDLKGPKGKFHMPSFGMSKPKMSGPDGDFDADLPDADLNISGPKLGGGMKAPKVNANFDAPDVDLKGPKGKFHMPSFGMSKPKISGPDGDFDADLPDADLNISGSKLGGGMKAPKVNANFDAPDVDLKGPKGKFHMPSFGMSKPKISGPDGDFDVDLPDADLNISGPKLGGGMKAPKLNSNLDTPDVHLKGPNIGGNISGPNIDFDGPGGNMKVPHLKMPKFNVSLPKASGPDFDADFDAESPNVNLKGPKVKTNMPNLKTPSFDADANVPNMGGRLNYSGPNMEGDLHAPDINFRAPKGSIDLDTDLDVKGPKGHFKGPDMKTPTFGFSGPKIRTPEANIDLDGSSPQVKGNYSSPGVNFRGPKVNADLGELDHSDLSLKSPNVQSGFSSKGSYTIAGHGAEISGDPKLHGRSGTLDLHVQDDEADLAGKKSKHKFKLPGFSVGPSKKKGFANISGDADASGKLKLSSPDVRMSSGSQDDLDTGTGIKIGLPKIGFS